MANFSVRNMPDDLYNELEAAAQRNRRSINSEIIHYIEIMIGRQQRRSKEEMLAYTAQLRERSSAFYMTNERLLEVIDHG